MMVGRSVPPPIHPQKSNNVRMHMCAYTRSFVLLQVSRLTVELKDFYKKYNLSSSYKGVKYFLPVVQTIC